MHLSLLKNPVLWLSAFSFLLPIGYIIANSPGDVPIAEGETEASYIQNLEYTYDNVGNITQIVDLSETATAKTVDYMYDDLNRLLSANSTDFAEGDYSFSYEYDSIGNMTYKSDVGTLTYGGTGSPTPHALTSSDSTNYTYDLNGNMTSDGTNTYTWTIRNELETVTLEDGTVISYTYDHAGQLLKMHNSATDEETIYVFPTMTIYPDETHYYTFLGDLKIATFSVPHDEDGNIGDPSTGELIYHHHDHLGSTMLSTDEDGNVIQTYDYQPYGTQLINDQEEDTPDTPDSFTGKEYSEDTGLYYFEARWYNPEVGRFVSLDPAQYDGRVNRSQIDPQLFNAYSYSRNNPINYTDSTGEYFESAADYIVVALSYLAYVQNPTAGNALWLAADMLALGAPLPNVTGYIRHGPKAAKLLKYFSEVADYAGKTVLSIAKSFWDNISFSQSRRMWTSGRAGESLGNLVGHYHKHGDEVGATSVDDYYNMANDFVDDHKGFPDPFKPDSGDNIHWDRDTNTKVITDQDGNIRSYYVETKQDRIDGYNDYLDSLDDATE